MATTAVAHKAKTIWHTRGSWSSRDDRWPSAVWLAILWVGMIAGFGVDLHVFVRENPPAPTIIYWHAAVFTTWMLLLTLQVLLVLGDRVAVHKRLGWLLAGWACLMAVLGPWAAMASAARYLHTPSNDPGFLVVNVVDIAGFLLLLGYGFSLRKNPAAHRRMMILATVALADPGFSRFSGHFLAAPKTPLAFFFLFFYGNVLLVVLMAAWDWRRGRLMRSFGWGASALLASELAASLLYFWGPWKALMTTGVVAWARMFG